VLKRLVKTPVNNNLSLAKWLAVREYINVCLGCMIYCTVYLLVYYYISPALKVYAVLIC